MFQMDSFLAKDFIAFITIKVIKVISTLFIKEKKVLSKSFVHSLKRLLFDFQIRNIIFGQ